METPSTDPAPVRVRGLPSWLLTQTAASAHRLVSGGLGAVGARGYHFRLLATLDESGPTSQAALGRHSGIHLSDIVATLNELAEQDLVERSPDPVDRRRNVITITPAGKRKLRHLEKVIVQVQDELLEPLSNEEREQLVRLLTRLLDHHGRG